MITTGFIIKVIPQNNKTQGRQTQDRQTLGRQKAGSQKAFARQPDRWQTFVEQLIIIMRRKRRKLESFIKIIMQMK